MGISSYSVPHFVKKKHSPRTAPNAMADRTLLQATQHLQDLHGLEDVHGGILKSSSGEKHSSPKGNATEIPKIGPVRIEEQCR